MKTTSRISSIIALVLIIMLTILSFFPSTKISGDGVKYFGQVEDFSTEGVGFISAISAFTNFYELLMSFDRVGLLQSNDFFGHIAGILIVSCFLFILLSTVIFPIILVVTCIKKIVAFAKSFSGSDEYFFATFTAKTLTGIPVFVAVMLYSMWIGLVSYYSKDAAMSVEITPYGIIYAVLLFVIYTMRVIDFIVVTEEGTLRKDIIKKAITSLVTGILCCVMFIILVSTNILYPVSYKDGDYSLTYREIFMYINFVYAPFMLFFVGSTFMTVFWRYGLCCSYAGGKNIRPIGGGISYAVILFLLESIMLFSPYSFRISTMVIFFVMTTAILISEIIYKKTTPTRYDVYGNYNKLPEEKRTENKKKLYRQGDDE